MVLRSRLAAFAARHRNAALWGMGCSVGIHVVRYQGGDYIAQCAEKRPSVDVWRSAAFAAFGAYCGSVFCWIYGPVYTGLFLSRGVPSLAVVLFDYGVTSQVVYFPAYYMLQEYIRSETPSWERAWEHCNNNRWDDFKALCTIYLPFSWLNYAKVAPAWRGTFSGCVGVIWAVYLSYSRGARLDATADVADSVAGSVASVPVVCPVVE